MKTCLYFVTTYGTRQSCPEPLVMNDTMIVCTTMNTYCPLEILIVTLSDQNQSAPCCSCGCGWGMSKPCGGLQRRHPAPQPLRQSRSLWGVSRDRFGGRLRRPCLFSQNELPSPWPKARVWPLLFFFDGLLFGPDTRQSETSHISLGIVKKNLEKVQ